MMTGEQRVTDDGGEEERNEVKGETGTGGQSCRLDGECAEHSSGSLQPFQFTESLENRMNG